MKPDRLQTTRLLFTKEELEEPYNNATTFHNFFEIMLDIWNVKLGVRFETKPFWLMDTSVRIINDYGKLKNSAWITSKILNNEFCKDNDITTYELLVIFKGVQTGTFNHTSFGVKARDYMMGDFKVDVDLPKLIYTDEVLTALAKYEKISVEEYKRKLKLGFLC